MESSIDRVEERAAIGGDRIPLLGGKERIRERLWSEVWEAGDGIGRVSERKPSISHTSALPLPAP